jgi:cupin superfamily acireductone dioxygenase involved in methionine salvage
MPEQETVIRETTSIKVKPDLWKEAKIEAVKREQTVSELVEEAIERLLKERGRDRK